MTVTAIPSIQELTPSARVGVVEQLLGAVAPNRYQKRQPDAGAVASLADNIRAHGLKQLPVGRWHPDRPGVIELADGHRRLAAYALLAKDDPDAWGRLPVSVQDLTDRQLYETCVIANEQRAPLSAIERAVTLRDYIAEFKASQAEAGKLFSDEHGVAMTQAGVSNLLRLLKLPPTVQDLVGHGDLPQALARDLIPLAKILPQEATAIADKVAKAEAADKADVLERAQNGLIERRARWFHGDPWDPKWPAKPIVVTGHKSISQIPACKGCEYFVERPYGSNACLRAECFDLKKQYAVAAEIEAACKKLKIGLAAGDQTELVYDGDARQEKLAANALATDRTLLRLAPHAKGDRDYGGYQRQRLLGTMHAELRTVDLARLRKQIANLPAAKKETSQNRYQDDYHHQQTEATRKRAEIIRIYRAAAPHVAKAFTWPEPVLKALIPPMASKHWSDSSSKIEERAKKTDVVGKARIVAEIVISERVGGSYMYSSVKPETARHQIEALAEELKVKLPADWWRVVDSPAIPALAPVAKKLAPNGKAAAAAAARAQVIAQAAAKKTHVRRHLPAPAIGHSRPAPKPSQLKKSNRRKNAKKGSK